MGNQSRETRSFVTKTFYAHTRDDNPDAASWQTLEDHLIGVAEFSKEFSGKIGLGSLGELMGFLHDYGKYSETFQKYLFNAAGKSDPDSEDFFEDHGLRGKIDHSTAGAQFVWQRSKEAGTSQPLRFILELLATCIASHHSGLIDCLSPNGQDTLSERMNKNYEKTHFLEVQGKIEDSILKSVQEIFFSKKLEIEFANFCKMGKGLLIPYLLCRFLFSSLIDADRMDAASRKPMERVNWEKLEGKLETHLQKISGESSIDKIRAEISHDCRAFADRPKGLFRLSVPTGGGKTLASLRFALRHAKKHNMDRVFYIIPYTSIIDQNAQVVREILDPDLAGNIVLEHHSNLTDEVEKHQDGCLAENWDVPVVFSTMVQFLETLFGAGTRGARRMHQLSNAIIVFDEIQTLPIKTVHLFNNAVNFIVSHCGSSVILCTATQPLLDQVDAEKGAIRFSENPEMMQNVKTLFEALRRTKVEDGRKPGGWNTQEISQFTLEEAERANSVLIVVNTKASAREIFKEFKEPKKCCIFHLSTNMCPAHRMEVLSTIKLRLKEKKPTICVSTQLIEAGVDVDFGCVIRYLAGIDSITQAAGRCNRNGLRPSGRVIVLNPSNENLDKLFEIRKAIEITERIFAEFEQNPNRFGNDLLNPGIMDLFYK